MTQSTFQLSTPTLPHHLLVAGRMPLAATQGNADDAAGESNVEAVCVFVDVQRQDTFVILVVRQAPGNVSENHDQRFI